MSKKMFEIINAIKIKDQDFKTVLLLIFAFCKPISDMLWDSTIVDVIMSLFAIVLFVVVFRPVKIKGYEILMILMGILFAVATIRDFSFLKNSIKFASPLLLYSIGKMSKVDGIDKLGRTLKYSYEVAVLVNLISFVSGKGFGYWGAAYVFSGVYYFKTDLAVNMVLAVIFIGLFVRHWWEYAFILSGCIMIFFSNTRMAEIILVFCALIKVYRIIYKNIKAKVYVLITLAVISGVIGMVLLKGIAQTAAGKCFNYIATKEFIGDASAMEKSLNEWEGISMENVSDESLQEYVDYKYINMYNIPVDRYYAINWTTQGRLRKWLYALDVWCEEGPLSIMIGTKNHAIGDPHSIYFAMLTYTGVVGFILFIIVSALVLKDLYKVSNDNYFYLMVIILAVIYGMGISHDTLLNTQFTWIPALLLGLILNREKN